MTKLLYFDWHSDGTTFYRLSPLDYIDIAGLEVIRSTALNIDFALLNTADIIFIERPSHEAALNIIRIAKDMGKRVIIDFDDDPLHLDQYNPMYSIYESQKSNVMEAVSLADEVWVSTPAIKKAFRLLNKNIYVIPNAHNDYLFPVSEKKPFTLNKKALWRGGHSHEGDIYDIGTPEKIIELVNTHKDWKFLFYGQRFLYLEKRCGDNYIACEGASTVQFHKMIQKENASVFFYPLADTVFNRSKSACSFLEATYAGSAFFGNKRLPEFDKDCIGEFSSDMLNASNLQAMNEASWELICEQFLVSKINKLRMERLEAI